MILMFYKTIEEYERELKEMEIELEETKEYIKKHPEKLGTQGNYKTMKYLYKVFKEDKINFINDVTTFNLKLHGESLIQPISIQNLNSLNIKFNETTNSAITLLKNKTISSEELLNKSISKGSYNIIFAFSNPTEEDVKRTSPRKRGLMKIFNFINCGDDIEKLKKEAGPNGNEVLKSYKEFLAEIIKHNADFTLDTEMGTVKAGLTLEQCRNICENLNV